MTASPSSPPGADQPAPETSTTIHNSSAFPLSTPRSPPRDVMSPPHQEPRQEEPRIKTEPSEIRPRCKAKAKAKKAARTVAQAEGDDKSGKAGGVYII